MKHTDFDQNAYCPKCDVYIGTPWMGNPFFLRNTTCPKCGYYSLRNTAVMRVEKWVSTSVWYKPSTWGSGYWIDPNGITSTERAIQKALGTGDIY